MAKLPRVSQKVFAGSAGNNGQFGSAAIGTKVTSTSIATIMALSAWAAGWTAATISGDNLPTLEEMQGIDFVITTQLAYLFQEGIPEWDSGTTYFINSVVKKPGTFEIYGSLVDNNTNNALPAAVDNSNWKYLQNLSAASLDLPEVSVASATTTNIGAAGSYNVLLTGTATITGFGTANAGVVRKVRCAAAATITYNATTLVIPGSANIVTAAGDTFEAFSLGSGNWIIRDYTPRSGQPIVPVAIALGGHGQTTAAKGFAALLPTAQLFNAGLAPALTSYVSANAIAVAAGRGTLTNNGNYMVSTAMNKLQTAVWAAGSGNGGMLGGVVKTNGQTLHYFELFNPSTGAVDYGYHTSATAPVLTPASASGFTEYRRIGAFKTDASGNFDSTYTQNEKEFRFTTFTEYNSTASRANALFTLSKLPTGVPLKAICLSTINTSGDPGVFVAPAENANSQQKLGAYLGTGAIEDRETFYESTNTSAQIYLQNGGGGNSVGIASLGYIDFTL